MKLNQFLLFLLLLSACICFRGDLKTPFGNMKIYSSTADSITLSLPRNQISKLKKLIKEDVANLYSDYELESFDFKLIPGGVEVKGRIKIKHAMLTHKVDIEVNVKKLQLFISIENGKLDFSIGEFDYIVSPDFAKGIVNTLIENTDVQSVVSGLLDDRFKFIRIRLAQFFGINFSNKEILKTREMMSLQISKEEIILQFIPFAFFDIENLNKNDEL